MKTGNTIFLVKVHCANTNRPECILLFFYGYDAPRLREVL